MTPAQIMWQQTTPSTISIALIIGVIVGYVYFKNLWWTISNLKQTGKRKTLLFLSALPRLILFIIAMLLVSHKNAILMGIYFLGFMIVKILMVHHYKKDWKSLTNPSKDKEKK